MTRLRAAVLAGICLAGLAPLGAAQAAAGLNGAYYAGGYGGNISGTPTATFNTNKVCFPSCYGSSNDADSLSNFLGVPSGYTTDLSADQSNIGFHALTLSGFIDIGTSGVQNFSLFSDDGSYLYIDSILVVNNGGDHAPGYAYGDIVLTAGQHSIYIYQEENAGITALTAALDGTVLSGSQLSTVAAVPEPAIWAMMLSGFGLIGGAMRNRRKTAVSFG